VKQAQDEIFAPLSTADRTTLGHLLAQVLAPRRKLTDIGS
jgi:hypothetical protein